jgi:uncharacterized membrane protein
MTSTHPATVARPSGNAAGRGGPALLLAASLAGMIATTLQIVDRIALAENPATDLVCDINATLSCGSVLGTWQARVLGVPNAVIGLAVFAVFASAGLGLLLGSRPSRAYLGVLEGLALGMLGFTLWFLWQTTFVIGALCLYCTVVGTAVLLIHAVVLRQWRRAGALAGSSPLSRVVRDFTDSGDDRWVWAAVWVGVAVVMIVAFAW